MKTSTKILSLGIIAMFAAAVSACSTCGCTATKSTCSDMQAKSDTSENLHAHSGNSDIVSTAAHAGKFNTLLAAAKAVGLVDTLKGSGQFTVFAPTDDAFAKLPEGAVESLLEPQNRGKLQKVLSYHVVPNVLKAEQVIQLSNADTLTGMDVTFNHSVKGVFVNNAKIIKPDVMASNGVIHVIDTVIMPQDIVATAVNSGKFNTLAAALNAAGLTDALRGDNHLTLFAPTDDAFAKLPKGTVESLLKPENKEKLISILTYHVHPGKLPLQQDAETVHGNSLSIRTNCPVMVNNAKVLISDINTTNGVIHAIDAVLIPDTVNAEIVSKVR